MAGCGAVHHSGAVCDREGVHADHSGTTPGTQPWDPPAIWPNESFVMPVREVAPKRTPATKLAAIARAAGQKPDEEPHAYVAEGASATSVQAASAALPESGTKRREVYDILAARASTDEEISAILDMPLNTVRPRRLELVERGLIVDTGATRPTGAGNPSTVWGLQR